MKISESYANNIECTDCGCESIKIPSTSSFELKGGGWYQSGYTK